MRFVGWVLLVGLPYAKFAPEESEAVAARLARFRTASFLFYYPFFAFYSEGTYE